VLHTHPERPQPRRDRDLGNGMTVSIGRIRSCPINDVRMVVLSHNTIRGAAGGALLNAELLVAAGYTSK
jgi:aspartate-semialdehyde dehydrogenase